MEEVELYIHYDAQGNATVSVVYPENNSNTLYIPAGTPPVERDELINAFKAEQQVVT